LRTGIVDSAKRGATNTRCIGKPNYKASGDSGRNPSWIGAILAKDLLAKEPWNRLAGVLTAFSQPKS
jgi:hypothetical protein